MDADAALSEVAGDPVRHGAVAIQLEGHVIEIGVLRAPEPLLGQVDHELCRPAAHGRRDASLLLSLPADDDRKAYGPGCVSRTTSTANLASDRSTSGVTRNRSIRGVPLASIHTGCHSPVVRV